MSKSAVLRGVLFVWHVPYLIQSTHGHIFRVAKRFVPSSCRIQSRVAKYTIESLYAKHDFIHIQIHGYIDANIVIGQNAAI